VPLASVPFHSTRYSAVRSLAACRFLVMRAASQKTDCASARFALAREVLDEVSARCECGEAGCTGE